MIAEARNNGCSKCDETDHACLDFHHINPANKLFSISRGRARELAAQKIADEIKKCVILCKNCHSKFHAGRFDL